MRSEEMAIYIGSIVGEFPIEVSRLLRKNSIVNSQYVPNSINQLVENTFFGLENSDNFKSDFANLMIEKGKSDSNLNKTLFLNNDGLSTNPSGSNTLGYVNAGVNLFSSAFSFFGKDKDIKSARETANAQIKSNELALEAKRLELQGKKLDADTALALAQKGGGEKSNTGLYIGLGVGGVVILGLVVFLAVKK
jgi:hypothetical protein